MDGGPYFFMHIPKTAGTSFRRMLVDLFPPERVLPNAARIDQNRGRYLNMAQVAALSRAELAACQLLIGHLPLAARTVFDTPPAVLTFLREPVARSVSALRHEQRKTSGGRTIAQLLDMQPQRLRAMTDRQTRTLSFETMAEAQAGWATMKPDRARLERAKDGLASCAFFGITERFGDSITLCERSMGWRFPTRDVVMNVAPPIDEDLTPLLPRLQEALQLDSELYEWACGEFEARIAALPPAAPA